MDATEDAASRLRARPSDSTGQPEPSSSATPGKLAAFLGLVGVVSALNYAGNYAGRSSKSSTDTALFHYSTAVGAVVVYAIILVIVVWIAEGRVCLPWQGIRNPLLALRSPHSWLGAIGLAILTLLVAGFVISIIDSFLHGGREQGVVPKHFMHGHAAEYAANWVVIAGVAPFVEETTYRGLGFSLFVKYGLWVAILATGLVFATSHGLVEALPELAIFGFALAWLRSRVDSAFPGMLVHCAFNSFALASVFWH
jgi:membrane protease YdiL (CAAX protease family)